MFYEEVETQFKISEYPTKSIASRFAGIKMRFD